MPDSNFIQLINTVPVIVAKATYSFGTDGGVQGVITPAIGPVIPAGSMIYATFIDILTALTSAGAATIGCGLGSGAQSVVFKALTGKASWVKGQLGSAQASKVTADSKLTLTVAVADLTAGQFDLIVIYVPGIP